MDAARGAVSGEPRRARRLAAAALAVLAASCADLFHSTDWSTRCGTEPCPTAAADAAGGAAVSGSAATAGAAGDGPVSCVPGDAVACYTGSPDTEGVGVCKGGTKTCEPSGAAYGPCTGEVTPTAEKCDTPLDESCDGTLTDGCAIPVSCAALGNQPSGLYTIDPDGGDPTNAISVQCDTVTDGGGWALLYNSIGSTAGLTPAFWQIAYADRLGVKGKPQLYENFYAGALYAYGKEYRDEIADTNGKVVEVLRASATGFDAATMAFVGPAFVGGLQAVYECQFAAGWSSTDHDADPYEGNCASDYLGVTQHYCACWYYNLGSDADAPHEDGLWGPHFNQETIGPLGLAGDGSAYSRASRISRWVRW